MLNAQLLMVFISKKTNNPNPYPTEMRFGLFFFGEGVLIGLFKKADFPRCFLISEQRISYFSLHIPSQQEVYSHSLRNVPKLPEGLSHGLKTCHRHVFLTAFRVPASYQKTDCPAGQPVFWCERGDSNPHGVTTRTSNVLVYHSNTLANLPEYYNLDSGICQ